MDERKTSRSRRRASRMLAEKRRKGPPVSCDDESPTRERAKPPRRKKKEPIYEEDIIEGFAIQSYLKFDDIEVSLNGGKAPKKKGTTNVSSSNNTNGDVVPETKVPEVERNIKQEVSPAPPPVKVNHVDKTNHQDPGTSDDSCREKEKIKREVAVIKRDPESEDNRVSDASSRCSSGRGYICDSEDDDKASDSGSVLFSASPPAVRKLDVANEVVNGHGGGERDRVGVTVKTNGSPRPPSPAAPPPPLQLPPQPQPPPQKPSPNHFSPVSIPNGVPKVERVSPPPAVLSSGVVPTMPQHHRMVPPQPQPPPQPVAYTRPGYPPGYPLAQPPHLHAHPHPHSHPHAHSQPSPISAAPTPPSLPPPTVSYHPPLYAPYNNTPYLPPTSHHQTPSRSPIGLKPITTSVGLVVTTTTTTTSHRDTINAPLIGRTHSPRGHSPTRERDSYSSNVSSLSRGSMGTPSSMPPYSAPHHPSVVPPVASVVAPSAQPSSLSYKQPSPWVSSSNPPVSAPGRTGLTPHHHPFAPPLYPPNPVAGPPVSSAPAPPSAPNPFSAESLFQSNQGDLLRRELDSRFLATQDRGPYIRTEMHHHQHQHTHVHQHTTPIIPPPPPTLFSSPIVNFKDMPKGTPVDSPFYRQSLGFTGYPGAYTPSLIHPSFGSATPFAPPTHLPTFTPKKTGKWNAMHVRVAWEIYHHQQKSGAGEGKVGPLIGKSDFMRPPTHMFGPPPPHPFTAPAHRTMPSAYDPPPPSFPPSMGGSVFGRYPPTGPSFPTALPSFPHAPSIHDPWGRVKPDSSYVHRLHPRGMPPQGFPPPSPWGLKPEVVDEREREKERERSRERERQRREEKQRQRQLVSAANKVRERSPLREPVPQILPPSATSKEEEVAMLSRSQHYLAARQAPRPLPPQFPQSPWDPYRYDPLRYNPLMAALQEEEQRAKLFGAYPGAPPSLAHLRPKEPSPSHRLPPAPHGGLAPKDDPTQPR